MPSENKNTEDRVDRPSSGYAEMAEAWDLIHDLLGGTRRMREQAAKWLPKEEVENDDDYNRRVNRSVLYEAFKDTLDKLVGKPFARPITVSNLPEQLSYLESNVDNTGKSLGSLLSELLWDLICYGKAHLIVDYTNVPLPEDGSKPSKAAEKQAGARITMVRVSPPSLIGWRSADSGNIESGSPTLSVVRVRESAILPVGEWSDETRNRIRVYATNNWKLYEQDKKDESKWNPIAEGLLTVNKVPVVTGYANQVGFMTAEPPLEGLAWLNLAHFQSDSDQRNILRYARFAILFAKGLSKSEAENPFKMAPHNIFTSSSETADMKTVEHSGAAITAGERDLEQLHERMERQGDQPLVRRTGQSTATSRAMDENRSDSLLQSWVREVESMAEESLRLAMAWIGITPPEDFKVDIFSDFAVSLHGTGDSDLLLKAALGNRITTKTLLTEWKRRGVLSDDTDIDDEVELLENALQNANNTDDDIDIDDEDEDEDEDELDPEDKNTTGE